MKLRRTIFGALAGMAILALAAPQGAVAQIWADYALSIVPRIYQPQTNAGIEIPRASFVDQFAPNVVDADNGVAGPIPLGFTFEYNGQPYTQIYVCVNGWISFQNPGGFLTDDPYSLFNNNRPNLLVAPFFGDHYYRRAGFDFNDPKGRAFTPSSIRYVQIPGDSVNPAKFILEWGNLNINYKFDPNRPDDPFAPIINVQPQAPSVGSFQLYLIEAPPGGISRAGDIEYHYGPVGPPIPFPDTVGSIVKTSGASVGINDQPAVSGGQVTYLNAVAFRESGGRFDSTTQSRRLTRVWPPTGFPSQVFLFSATRLRRVTDWGDGDANLTQLDNNIPQFIREDQRRFVTFLDVIHILRHQATRNIDFDSTYGRHGFHGDVNHNGRYYFSSRNYTNTADSLDGFGNLVRYKVFFPTKSTNYQLPQPIDDSFNGFLFDANEFDASLIMLYLAAKLPRLPWLPDTLPPFTGKLMPRIAASDVQMSRGQVSANNRIEIPITLNGYLSGSTGLGLEAGKGMRIIEVRTAPQTDNQWVVAVATEDRLALAAAGNFGPNDVVATLVVEANSAGDVVFNQVHFGEEQKGMRKLSPNGTSDAATLSLMQNAPNPFTPNSTTSIGYSVSNNGKVAVRIYDVLGREVKTLANTVMNAGSYSIEWNGTDAAGNAVETGVYYCRIESAGQTRTISMQVRK